jgi:alpha-amylase
LLRSYALSDDISFRFSDRGWSCWPLCADTYAGWLHGLPSPAQYVGLFMDYETFGEHQDASTGIFEFVRHLPEHVLADPRFRFRTPAQVAAERPAVDELDFREPVSWADPDRGLSPWIGNPMQLAAHRALYALRPRVAALAASRPDLLAAWRRLCTSDHVHYVATGGQRDDGGHDRSRPFGSPHGAFVTLMTVLDDLRLQVERAAATIGRPDR